MSVFRLFRYSIRLAAWATPHIQRWARNYNLNANEADRNFSARNYTEAEKYYAAAIRDAERRHSPEKRKLHLILRLAECQRRRGDFDSALITINDAIGRAQPGSAGHGDCLQALALVHSDRRQPEDALQAARSALQIARTVTPPNPGLVGERCYQLAGIERCCGNTQQYLNLVQESLALFEQAYGAEHVETANRLTAMGVALKDQGSLPAALPFFEKASKLHQQLIGPDSPEAVTDLEHLAHTHFALQNLEQAVSLYERLLRFRERQVGLTPNAYGRVLINAAEVYAAAGKQGSALETVQQALRLLDRSPEHIDAAAGQIARVYDGIGRSREAEQFRNQALNAK